MGKTKQTAGIRQYGMTNPAVRFFKIITTAEVAVPRRKEEITE
jgi:hypothetical protein